MPITATQLGMVPTAPMDITAMAVMALLPITGPTGQRRVIAATARTATITRVVPTGMRGAVELLTRRTVLMEPSIPGAAGTTTRLDRLTTTEPARPPLVVRPTTAQQAQDNATQVAPLQADSTTEARPADGGRIAA